MNPNQKGKFYSILVVVLVILIGVVLYFSLIKKSTTVTESLPTKTSTTSQLTTPSTSSVSFEARREGDNEVLYKVTQTGAGKTYEKTGLVVAYDWDPSFAGEISVVVSPDQKKAVFDKWSDTLYGLVLYVADIDGSNMRQIATQEVGEGSGGLNGETILWTDSSHITYKEYSIICEADCGTNPSSRTTTYQVNVETGQKTVVERKDY